MTELKATAHLMTLEPGVFCITQAPGGPVPRDGSGLPGVRISLPPGPASRPEAVSIASFRGDGWLGGPEDAVLVRVSTGPAQVLVTIYQSHAHGAEAAPRMQVARITPDLAQQIAAVRAAQPPGPAAVESTAGVVAHVARAGDLRALIGSWVGTRGSKNWIEGFGILPADGIGPGDIEYQGVLGRGWLSPWVEGGKFCGSRGMALPLLGLRVRLRGAAAEAFDCSYSATFVDGTEVGPVGAGEACEAESLSPLEAFQLVLRHKEAATAAARRSPSAQREPAEPRAQREPAEPRAQREPAEPRAPRVIKSATTARRPR